MDPKLRRIQTLGVLVHRCTFTLGRAVASVVCCLRNPTDSSNPFPCATPTNTSAPPDPSRVLG
ncbi:hypothetical protein K491DRAFT_688638 [Lophiostoma macrostomum CBS 122681]|uniref:Uncharacterized protein n=1 Tax=Lophiostoma macrostomum CBS 122681 TaxID=1314788 RepID=A0A6A6TM76_9PLEO|nr:hypothetical protein K491DRAFT_688638 [Lophiostoma macrostomum CBS 122681]